jgi:hypothetical protein
VTIFHGFQLVLAVAMVALVIERVRALCFRGALDGSAFRRALVGLVRRGRVDRAGELASAARPAFAARAVWPLLDPAIDNEQRHVEVHDTLMDVENGVGRRLRALRIGATVASLLGFLGAALDIHWVFAGEHGLLPLQAGLVESMGLSRAALSISIGISTSAFAIGVWSLLRHRARELVMEARRVVGSIEEILEKREENAKASA